MKKHTLLFAFILAGISHAFGQSEFEKKVSERACTCMNNARGSNLLTESQFLDCLQTSFLSDSAAIISEVLKAYGDTSEEHAHEFGEKSSYKVMNQLVMTCDAFYQYMESLRQQEFQNANADSLNKVLQKLEATPETGRTLETHTDLATSYFLLKKFDKALPEIEKGLAMSPDNTSLIFYKAYTLELLGKYDDAIQQYQKVVDKTGSGPMEIFMHMAKRKKARS